MSFLKNIPPISFRNIPQLKRLYQDIDWDYDHKSERSSNTSSLPEYSRLDLKRPNSYQAALMNMMSQYETILVVDDSLVMDREEYGVRIWNHCRKAVLLAGRWACKFNTDATKVYLLSKKDPWDCETTEHVLWLMNETQAKNAQFSVSGMLEHILWRYMAKMRLFGGIRDACNSPIKPINIILFTSAHGEQEWTELRKTIIKYAKELDERGYPSGQIGIQLVQIGHDEPTAEVLSALDDCLPDNAQVRDIVDWTQWEPNADVFEKSVKIMTGSICRGTDNLNPPAFTVDGADSTARAYLRMDDPARYS